jgi:hypothetical protein
MNMRDYKTEHYQPITWSQLNAQKDFFKTQPELFNYLRAIHLFFIQNKPQDALNYLPKSNTKNTNYLQLSQTF